MNQCEWQIRPLQAADAATLSGLSFLIGWGQNPVVTENIIRHAGGHALGAFYREELIGSAAAVLYADDRVAFINQVTVHPGWRRRGIATDLVRNLVRQLDGHAATLRLYATDTGAQVYRKLGFTPYATLSRCVGGALTGAPPSAPGLAPMLPNDLTAVCALDRADFGCDRADLLRELYRRSPHCAWCARTDGVLQGFVLGRQAHAGTVQCTDPEWLAPLLACALFRPEGGQVTIDLFRDLTLPAGFKRAVTLIAMEYGDVRPAPPHSYWSTLGADVG